ncbi:MAG: DnaJ C-terminal domain-containing protein [Armatimonadota bacterium]|nr:DnaJ C-terminal domain-containing protein [Armatimonadota bacterium]MDR7423171.1 DnaJ C-terminal domain-containing protein [Armatimonadota bacterium]MDR7455172.1 DnaJ C-terminal domain-containing protein [Armatimonadota bacterium]MDR7496581.1 DnaJ C-terminal domain-containing protein [Armatimonadota bacterium]MDR7510588.1 DnaJ C-terminal domain-containing protein [Armatimonadota bacterium]
MEFKDYYQALGVDRSADQKTITQAFRRLAREHHPDVSKKKGAEDRFKEINEAYQVLGDPKKRAQYDQIYDAYKSGGGAWQDLFGRVASGRTWTGPGGVTFHVEGAEGFEDLFGRAGGLGGFSEFFQQLFGGLGGATGRPGPDVGARPRLEAELEITLEDAYHGTRRRVQLAGGRALDVEIPRGVRDGQTIRLAGAADGRDVYVRVRLAPHPRFERTDDDLTVEVPLAISDAALGAQVEVPTLDGPVTMTVPAGTQTGARFRLKGLGMPHARGGGRGDLYARVRVVTPTGLSPREREIFEELRRLQREGRSARRA